MTTGSILHSSAQTGNRPMQYRRFGQTGEHLSVLTLGGMRFPHGWDPPRQYLPKDALDNCIETTQRSFELGINHIETAHGYMKSEHLFGAALKELGTPRDQYKMMTKGAPMNRDDTLRLVEEQLKALRLDHVEFYGWHGINNVERLQTACAKGGPVETLHRLKEQGVIKHIGFSTHGPTEILLESIETGLFSFINLHYYYFFQRHLPVIELAGKRDLGILIISPNDKGGQLWNASDKVRELCQPMTPIQFNGRFCLSHPQVTTLTLGMHHEEHFQTNLAILKTEGEDESTYRAVKQSMDAPLKEYADACTVCHECLPCPEKINIPEVLRFRNLLEAYDMEPFGRYRYNMLEEKDHWFPGTFASRCTECGDCMPRCPENLEIPKLLKDTHNRLFNRKAWLKKKLESFFAAIYLKVRRLLPGGPGV